jgi:hypothetical protein
VLTNVSGTYSSVIGRSAIGERSVTLVMLSVALQNHVKALVVVAGLVGAGDDDHYLVVGGERAEGHSLILAVAVAHHVVDPGLQGAAGQSGLEGRVGLHVLAAGGAAHGGIGKLEEAYESVAAGTVVVYVERGGLCAGAGAAAVFARGYAKPCVLHVMQLMQAQVGGLLLGNLPHVVAVYNGYLIGKIAEGVDIVLGRTVCVVNELALAVDGVAIDAVVYIGA